MSVNEVKQKRLDESKLFNVKGTGPPTNRTFAIGNEDHTLGNALRHVRGYLLSLIFVSVCSNIEIFLPLCSFVVA